MSLNVLIHFASNIFQKKAAVLIRIYILKLNFFITQHNLKVLRWFKAVKHNYGFVENKICK